ncbi:hypothetical protein [Turicibacter sanguinis]|uniref:hypothetical protein n=1 Tax=Turicibacter sanguinis TaxID=154288 RepID=UPI0018AAE18C|nr:hypothetical protein [Turicibacter sanguinis]MDB8554036.1 hypothetical protein [Turicibacter sanguinis]
MRKRIQNNYQLEQNKYYNSKCNSRTLCPLVVEKMQANQVDLTNKRWNLVITIIYLLIGLMILGDTTDISQDYFSNVALYCLPLIWDAIRWTVKHPVLRLVKIVRVAIVSFGFIISLIGKFTNIFVITKNADGIFGIGISPNFIFHTDGTFPLLYFWCFIAFGVSLIIIEFTTLKPPKELAIATAYKKEIFGT